MSPRRMRVQEVGADLGRVARVMKTKGDVLCLHCTGWVRHSRLLGWVHIDGNGPIWQRCISCGWSGSEASGPRRMPGSRPRCPDCGRFEYMADHHVAMPDRRAA